jgi:hypothetical protein
MPSVAGEPPPCPLAGSRRFRSLLAGSRDVMVSDWGEPPPYPPPEYRWREKEGTRPIRARPPVYRVRERRLVRLALAACVACAAVSGCTTGHDPGAKHASADALHVPLALRGENTILRIEFPSGVQNISPGQFQQDEVCYMNAGKFRIDCYNDSSSLNLGPTDSNDLLTDNPGWKLEPAGDDEQGRQLLKVYSVLTLVAGSVDRLPATLADYIQSPGAHLTEALDLTEQLLTEDQVRLTGFARGGNFNVTVQLSDDGREKLQDALDEAGDSGGNFQLVRARVSKHPIIRHAVKAGAARKPPLNKP